LKGVGDMVFTKLVPVMLFAAFTSFLANPSDARPRARSKSSRPMRVTATAYCQHGKTESGAEARRGTIAADPRLLPLGSLVRIQSTERHYSGTYTVLDTGSKVKGRKIDIFVPSCATARTFGKRIVMLTVLRRGPAGDVPSL
jgi:3D (Asp-Asp-Asp) domain-containing protein